MAERTDNETLAKFCENPLAMYSWPGRMPLVAARLREDAVTISEITEELVQAENRAHMLSEQRTWKPIDIAPKDRPILWRSHAHRPAPDVIRWDGRLGEWWSYRLGFLIQVLGEWCEVPK